ncbi:hypothetical protein TSUD_127330 [Trifolium subterraneum]|nr:hypothetical protein TSUD_127330 [Trifolium subterraneum]
MVGVGVAMKIFSYNIRGFGAVEKRREIRRLISEKRPDVFCLHETKLEAVDDVLCRSLWGSAMVQYSFKLSVGASGGIITMWDASAVHVWMLVNMWPMFMLRVIVKNWGPKPLRMLKCWADIPGYDDFVKVKCWASLIVDGVSVEGVAEEVLKIDLLNFFAEFHHNGKLTKGLNSTFIALIPKVESPQRVADFRPIALVSSVYKILSKVLANRLRTVVGKVVSTNQSAFIKDRQILDVILIANEIVDEAKKEKKDPLLFKVDFEKACDSVDWGYLEEVMLKMNFPGVWRNWIMECVTTATASVLVNGSPTDEFGFKRGLRQGDSLSPFLFLLAAEGLHVTMSALVSNRLFTPFGIGPQNAVSISHLQFADDTLLVGVKSWANVQALKLVDNIIRKVGGWSDHDVLGRSLVGGMAASKGGGGWGGVEIEVDVTGVGGGVGCGVCG